MIREGLHTTARFFYAIVWDAFGCEPARCGKMSRHPIVKAAMTPDANCDIGDDSEQAIRRQHENGQTRSVSAPASSS